MNKTTLIVKSTTKEPDGRKAYAWTCQPSLPAVSVMKRLATIGLTNLRCEGNKVTVSLGEIDSRNRSERIEAIHKAVFL